MTASNYSGPVKAYFVGGPMAGEQRMLEHDMESFVASMPPRDLYDMSKCDPNDLSRKPTIETYRYRASPRFNLPGSSMAVVFYYPVGIYWDDMVYQALRAMANTTAANNELEKTRYA